MKVTVSFSKKLPVPGIDYASQQASISIEGDTSPDHITQTAQQLYRQAEAAVDQQLSQQNPAPAATAERRYTSSNERPAPARPGPNNGRRGPPPASSSQLRLLGRLLSDDHAREEDALAEFRVGQLADLSIAQASQLIDRLKGGGR